MKVRNLMAAAVIVAGMIDAKAAFTESATFTDENGVVWTVALDKSNNTARIGNGNNAAISASAYPVAGGKVVTIPSSITVNDTEYTVTTLGANSFKQVPVGIGVIIPTSVTTIGNYAFSYTKTANYSIKGPVSADSTAEQTYQTVSASAAYVSFKNSARRFLFVGPNVKWSGSYNPFRDRDGTASDLTVLVPSRSDNAAWDNCTADGGNDDFGGGENTTIYRYGPDKEFDLLMGDTQVTAIPTTEGSLTNVLNWAQTFKSAFGLDTKIAITNRIAMTGSVQITEKMLQSMTLEAPPWYLTFQVTSQAELDNVLAAVSVDTPIIIDIEGAGRNQITVPDGRKVAILAKSGWTFGRKQLGLIISFL